MIPLHESTRIFTKETRGGPIAHRAAALPVARQDLRGEMKRGPVLLDVHFVGPREP
jgi:hypothetical protein